MNLEQAVLAVDNLMLEAVETEIPVLQEASRHIISAGGKRVRPRLLFLSYSAIGGTDLQHAIAVAAALELVHTATLVHDDINDHGHFRRGRVTINERWGRTFALLTGDYLFTKVYELMAPYGALNATLAEATVALVEGETLQAWAAKEDRLDREIYQQIVAKKTASLFRASAMLGAQLHDPENEYVDVLGEFGFYLGLAFQIIDDLLDLIGDPSLVGKDLRIDASQGKGVAKAAGENGQSLTPSAVGLLESEPERKDEDPFRDIKRRLIAGGAVDEARQMADVLAVQANAVLEQLPPSGYVDQLRDLVTLVINRQR